MKQSKSGFTIVELLVVIAVIAILATIGFLSFTKYQTATRDTQRSSRATILVEALEKYYEQNGEYPGCLAVSSANVSTVTTTVLPDVDPSVLLTPKSVAADTNSIECVNLTGATNEADVFAYVGDGSTACASGQSCLEFTLKYIDEETGVVKAIDSRHRTDIATSGTSTLTVAAQNFTQINASWLDIDNAATYELQRATNNGFTANVVSQTVSGISTAVTGLSYNTQYYFRIRPLATASQGDWSNTTNATTWALTAPTITAAAQSFTQINTSWGAISHGTSYEAQLATNAAFTTGLTSQTTAGTTANFTGLAFNTTYYLRVRALGGGFTGAWSATDTEPTWGLSTPTTAATATSTTTFTTSWAAISHAATYNVQCSSDGSTWSGCAASTAALSFGWGPTGQGTRLYFRTQAVNGAYTGSWSANAVATSPIDNPGAFPLYSTNTLPNWNYLNVGSGVSCPAGTTPSSDWYANGSYWMTGGVSQSYGLSWNTSVTVSVASRCTTAVASSGFVWANNTASMDLPWSSVWMGIPSYRRATWGATCPKWTTASTYDWWVRGNSSSWLVGENGVQTTAYDNQGIVWGDGDGRVAIHCYGPWGGDARSDGWTMFGSGCYPTITSSWCTY